MRYFYESNSDTAEHGSVYMCNHPLYNRCTLYLEDDLGLAVIQQRFNKKNKFTWWGPIDRVLIDDIYSHDGFKEYFMRNASKADSEGLYPTVELRKLMWALRMKPLKREYWER